MKSKIKRTLIFIIYLLILIESILFVIKILPSVTVTREPLDYETEKTSTYSVNRQERLMLASNYRYFMPNVKRIKTAFDTDSIRRFDFVVDSVNLREVTDNVMDHNVPIKEIYSESLYDVVIALSRDYESFSDEKKRFYLNLIDLAIEQIMTTYLYDVGVPLDKLSTIRAAKSLVSLKMNILEAYDALLRGQVWSRKDIVISLFRQNMSLESVRFQKLPPEVSAIFRLINDVSCAKFLLFVRQSSTYANVNSFVCSKEYLKLINLYERFKYYDYSHIIRAKIKADTSITEDIIRFYSKATIIGEDKYFSDFEDGKLKKGILYIHKIPNVSLKNSTNNKFSYEIIKAEPNIMKIKYSTQYPGFIYFSDGYDNHWRAFLDNAEIEIYKANGAFKAVSARQGTHVLTFRYSPVFYKFSILIYYMVCAIVFVFLTIYRKD